MTTHDRSANRLAAQAGLKAAQTTLQESRDLLDTCKDMRLTLVDAQHRKHIRRFAARRKLART